jgi:hypothetical protein
VISNLRFSLTADDDRTTAPDFLPPLAKGLAALFKIVVIGTCQKRAEVFSRDSDAAGVPSLYP